MNSIPPIGHPSGVPGVVPNGRTPTAPGRTASPPAGDSAVLSPQAQFLSKLANLNVRQDLIDRVKAEIASGDYEKPGELAAKVDALLSELHEDLQ